MDAWKFIDNKISENPDNWKGLINLTSNEIVELMEEYAEQKIFERFKRDNQLEKIINSDNKLRNKLNMILIKNCDYGSDDGALLSVKAMPKAIDEILELLNDTDEPISQKVSRILDKHLPANGLNTEREKLREKLHRDICTLIVSNKQY
jgi:hypothetical protein